MAKKTTPKKKSATKRTTKTTSKPTSKSGGTGAASSSKKTTKKAASKPVTKKTAKTTTKKAATSKKAVTKKSASKPAAKKVAKKTAKATATKAASSASKKAATTKAPTEKADAKSTSKKVAKTTADAKSDKVAEKGTTKPAADAKSTDDKAGDDGKPNRKGITIVNKRPTKKTKASSPTGKFPPTGERLLGPNSPIRRPLIPSGPSAAGGDDDDAKKKPRRRKSSLSKTKIEEFRELLLQKRRELMGDVARFDGSEPLGEGGGLDVNPAHIDERDDDTFDPTLLMNLAAADRKLIGEINDALSRIEDGTYGICQHSGQPISEARLRELPWARYSIDSARELERRQML